MSYFNDDQQDYMRSLAALTPEQKCDCGWSLRGQCFGQCYGKPEKGGAEKREAVGSTESTPGRL